MADYTLSARITADASGFARGISDAKTRMQGLSDSVRDTQERIGKFGAKTAATGAVMTAGITAPFAAAINMTAEFDSAMRKAGAIAGANAAELDKMTAAALDLGATTSLSGSEVAVAMSEMAAKGFDATQVISAMPGVIAAAEASGEDLALTADTVASAITGFGLAAGDSGRVADVLAMAANATAAGVGDMGYAFKYAAPVANNLGISMEELAAATGIMTNAGLDGSQAGTTLRMALGRLVKPTAAGATALENLGVNAVDAQGNFKPLHQIVGDLQTGMEGMTAAQQQAALATIFGTEAASGMAIILGQGQEGLQKLTKELENSEGASATAAAQMKAGIGGALENLSGAAESATISLMSQLTPTIAALATRMSELIDKFNGVSEGTKKIIAFGILGMAALGPLLTIVGVMTMGLAGLMMAVGFLLSPIGLVIVGIAAFAAAFATAMVRSEEFRNAVMTAFNSIREVVTGVIATVLPILQNLWTGALSGANSFADGLGGKLLGAFETVKSVVMTVVGVVGQFVSAIVDGFGGAGGSVSSLSALFLGFNPILKIAMMVFTQFGPQIAAGFQQIAALVMPIVTTLGTMLGQLAATVIPIVMGVVMELVGIIVELGGILFSTIISLLPIVMNLFNSLVPIIMMVVQQLGAIISTIVPLVANLVSSLFPAISMIAQVLMNIVTSVAPAFIAIVGLIGSALSVLLPIVSSILQAVIHLVTNIIQTIMPLVGFIGGVISAIIAIIAPIVTFIAGVMSSIFQAIRPIVDVVTGVFNIVIQVISDVWQRIMTYTGGIFISIGTIISGLSGVVSGVFNAISGTISSVMNNVSRTITGVFDAIRGAWTGLTTFVDGIFNGISGNVQALVNQVKGFVNGVIGGVNAAVSLINKIPGVHINPIPYLARGTDNFGGGFARMNEGGRGEMVLLPGGSQVIPHDVSMKYAREAGHASAKGQVESKRDISWDIIDKLARQDRPINLSLEIDGREFARATSSEMDEELGWRIGRSAYMSGIR